MSIEVNATEQIIEVNATGSTIDINVSSQTVDVNATTSVIEVTASYNPGINLPSGGTTGQVLKKQSNTDYDTYWAVDEKGVPYVGATGDVDLGEYELKAGQIELDQSPTGTAGVAVTRWNDTIGSTETTLKGGNVVLKNGVDLVARIVNKVTPNTTLTKAAYQAVRISGAQGQRLAVALAQANNDNNSADTIGLVTETIATNQEGFIMTVGSLEGINTTGSLQGETWTDGDVLYLSPTVAGAITNVKPIAPQHLVVIGYVEYAHANNGKIYVKVMNGWELGELHDVDTTGATNGQVLKYNGSIWTPQNDLNTGTVTSVDLSAPTGFVVSGNPITSSGTLALSFASGYSLPTTIKQSNWDDAYTFVSAFPSQTGNSGKYLTTDGSTLSWGTVSTANIYNSDGTLTGNRTVTMGSFTLSFEKDISVYGLTIGRGGGAISTNTAIGYRALIANTTGANNVAIGYDALRSSGGNNYSIAIGQGAMSLSTGGAGNIGIGQNALQRNNQFGNIALGTSALNASINGENNTAIGENSLASSTANQNTALGNSSLRSITTGSNNTGVGMNAGRFFGTGTSLNETSSNSLYLGHSTRASANGNSNEVVVGYNTVGLGSNTTVIGNSSTTDTAIYGRMLVNYGTPVIGTYALDVNGTGRFTSNLSFTGGAFVASSVYYSSTYGLVFAGGTGSSSDVTITDRGGNLRIEVVNGGEIRQTGTKIQEISIGTSTPSTGGALYTGTAYGLQIRGRSGATIFHTGLLDATGNDGLWINTTGQVKVGNYNDTFNNSAILEAVSTTKGFLPPRMTAAQKTAISTPATGLVIYQTDSTEGLYQYKSTGWEAIGGGGGTNIYNSDGTLTGNRTVTSGGYNLTFTGSNTASSAIASGLNLTHTLVAAANNDVLVGLDINPTFTNGAFTGVQNIAIRANGSILTRSSNPLFIARDSDNDINALYLGADFGTLSGSTSYATFAVNRNPANGVFFNTGRAASQINLESISGDASIAFYTSVTNNTTPTERGRIFGNGNWLIGTGADAGFRFDISGTCRIQDNTTVSKNFNGNTTLTISNTTAGTLSNPSLVLTSDSSSGSAQVFKYSSSSTAYKIISASDSGIYNATAGDISILNDFATGKIKLAAGSSSTAQATLFSTGNFIIGGTTDAGYKLDVQGTLRVTGASTFSSQVDIGNTQFFTGANGTEGIKLNRKYLTLSNGVDNGLVLDAGNGTSAIAKIYIGGGVGTQPLCINGGGRETVFGSDTATSSTSALVRLESTTKGFLPPRMTETQKNAISTPATGLVIYQTDGTEGLYQYKSTGWNLVAGTGGGGGISRSVNVISTTTTAGASASTDYVYLISGTTTLTLPTAVGNTNRYTLKNVGTNTVTINTTSSQTIDGSASITMAVRYTALDVISDGTNWNII